MTKVLVVEDNEMNMRLFSDLLKTKKYEVFECMQGSKALGMVKKIHPDLVLMDIQMPEISGIDITKMIRETPAIAQTPILAVSAFAMKSDEERILKAGVNGYISKPISIPLFFETVAHLLKEKNDETCS